MKQSIVGVSQELKQKLFDAFVGSLQSSHKKEKARVLPQAEHLQEPIEPTVPSAVLASKIAEETRWAEETITPVFQDESFDTALASQLYQDSQTYNYDSLYQPKAELPLAASKENFLIEQELSEKEFESGLALENDLEKIDAAKINFNDTLAMESAPLMDDLHDLPEVTLQKDNQSINSSMATGGSMADLSGYKDLSRPPIMAGEDKQELASSATQLGGFDKASLNPETYSEMNPDVDTEFSGNVQTLIRLVNELPDGVTKQTGAQIIRLTMEAMGISMEDVLSDAQSAQSEMLDAVRANIKKIEEYKTVIRKLETDIKYYQGKANELSEIIDLFILSNTSTKVPLMDEFNR